MFEMSRVNQKGYESDTEIYDQNHKKMAEALNEAELVRLTTEQHVMETKKYSECWPYQGPGNSMSERLLKEREFKDAVVHMF